MKLLITTFTFAPERNGVAEVVGAHAQGLAQRGHDVTVATTANTERNPDSLGGVKVAEFGVSEASRRDAASKPEIERYRQFLASFPCNAILCHCWRAWPTDFAAPALPRNPAKKILVSHGYTAQRWQRYPGFPWGLGVWLRSLPYLGFTRRLLRKYDHAVFLSPRADWNRFFDHKLVDWLGYPRWTWIPNGSEPRLFEGVLPDFRALHGIGNDLLVLCVSAYSEAKNQQLALRAFLDSALPRATLVFIGSELNDYAASLREMNERVNTRPGELRVIFLEKQTKELIRAAYTAADLFLFSSVGETQPLVILDAMASGTPFVSTDVGCVSEMPGGLIVRNQPEMAAALGKLHDDADLRRRLAESGRDACRATYNWDSVVESYERLLVSLKKS